MILVRIISIRHEERYSKRSYRSFNTDTFTNIATEAEHFIYTLNQITTICFKLIASQSAVYNKHY
ncbi:hypothetical protein WQ53_09810 [Pseudoxanthomonas suwonensis]|uniref:Uncharacterized protein n=1 Tax=Pseudoxanthomonas suwonensis TaxID=314722 RepID=A0A0E3Z1C6_9GAMM|nr:hypothetical protein WQ53_09810 [Pseudoxanthomonas suwonensis]